VNTRDTQNCLAAYRIEPITRSIVVIRQDRADVISKARLRPLRAGRLFRPTQRHQLNAELECSPATVRATRFSLRQHAFSDSSVPPDTGITVVGAPSLSAMPSLELHLSTGL
jgi:hypothetical protein